MKRALLLLLLTSTFVGNAVRPPAAIAQIYREAGTYSIKDGPKSRAGRSLERVGVGQVITVSKGGRLFILMNKSGKRYLINGGSEIRIAANGPVHVKGVRPREVTSVPPSTTVLITNPDQPNRVTATNVRAPADKLTPRGALRKPTAMLSWKNQQDIKFYEIDARNEETGDVIILGTTHDTEPCKFALNSAILTGRKWWRITVKARRSADADPIELTTYVRFMDPAESARFETAQRSIESWENGPSKSIALGQVCREFDMIDDARKHFGNAQKTHKEDQWLKQQIKALDEWPATTDL